MGHFPAKLRLLHRVTGGLHLNYVKPSSATIEIQYVTMNNFVDVFQKMQLHNFASLQSVYGCLSVYRHNVSPNFYTHCLFKQLMLLLR